MGEAELLDTLQRIVGTDYVRHRPTDLMVYEYDGSVDGAVDTARPFAVVLPKTTDEVAAVVRAAKQAGLPIVARGAGTGLSGGAVAQQGGLIVALTRMDRILDVSIEDRTALVEPGVINLELSEDVQHLGLFFAPDPSSQKACTIGGNVAENAGGPHCLKYGVTTNHILGCEIVLPDGSIIWTDRARDGFGGFDLTAAVVGSEGMLGIVTKVLVRLTSIPQRTGVLLAAFPTMDAASDVVTEIIAAGNLPAALEMVDHLTIQAVEPVYHAGYPMDAGAALLIELDGHPAEVGESALEIERICQLGGASSLRQATDPAERAQLWKGRKMALAAMGRIAPNYYLHDTVVPRSMLTKTLTAVNAIADEHRVTVANVFHAGDGNLHPLMVFDRREAGIMDRVLEASHAILEQCVALGGTLSGEHGIGTEKRDHMPMVYTQDDLRAMAGLKVAFDPDQQFNPEKVFPKGYFCGDVLSLAGQFEAHAAKHGIYPM